MSSTTAAVIMSCCDVLITVCLLLFLGWRLIVLDRQQQEHYDESRQFQLEIRKEHQRRLDALQGHVEIIEVTFREMAVQLEAITPWVKWWASELAQEVQQ